MTDKSPSVPRGQPDPRQPKGPAIVLVNPQMGENIGMCARAMLNCGMTDLRIVDPRDGWPNEAAMATASGATMVIEQARIFGTLREAIADCRFAVGTGSFDRDMVKTVLTPEQAAEAVIRAYTAAQQPVSAVVFGRERAGLTNEEVTQCDAYVTVPLNPSYPSLNLAQAVLLVGYAWYARITAEQALPTAGSEKFGILGVDDAALATKDELEGLFEHVVASLDAAAFFPTEAQRPAMVRNLRNTFHRLRLTSQEIRTFRGALKALSGKK